MEIEEHVEEKGSQEARAIKGQSRITKPTQQEHGDHMRTHIPYRTWCTQCVEGRRVEEQLYNKMILKRMRKHPG